MQVNFSWDLLLLLTCLASGRQQQWDFELAEAE